MRDCDISNKNTNFIVICSAYLGLGSEKIQGLLGLSDEENAQQAEEGISDTI